MKPLAKLLPEQQRLRLETDPKGRYRLMADTAARWPLEERKAAPVAYMAGLAVLPRSNRFAKPAI